MMPAAIDMLPGSRCDGLLLALMNSPEKRLPSLWAMVAENHARGHLSSDAYDKLSEAYGARGETFRVRRQFGAQRLRHPVPSIPERPTRRRKARVRRRVWSGSGGLPSQLRGEFTPGEQAVASVMRTQLARNGRCDLAYGDLARRAGLLGTTVVKRFVRRARQLGLIKVQLRPVRGGKNNTNVITLDLTSQSGAGRLWQWWISYEGKGIGGTTVSPDKSPDLKYLSQDDRNGPTEPAERPQRAYERKVWAGGAAKSDGSARRMRL
jgi:hypothetical protein